MKTGPFKYLKLAFDRKETEQANFESLGERGVWFMCVAHFAAILLAEPDDVSAFLARAGARHKFKAISALREFLLQGLRCRPGQFGYVNDQSHLGVERSRAWVEVKRTHE